MLTKHLRNLYFLLNDHTSASSLLWGCPFGSRAKTKVGAKTGTSDSWLALMLPTGKHNQSRHRTTSGDSGGYTILLRNLSTPNLLVMTAWFNPSNTVQKIHRNIRDHAASPHPKRHVLSSMTPRLGKESIRGTSKGTRSPFKTMWREQEPEEL